MMDLAIAVKAHDTAYFCRSEHVGIRLRNNFHGAGSDEVSYGIGPILWP
jgi:hypothetical protein